MIRLPAVTFAVVLFVVPLLTAPIRAIAVTGLIGLLLASLGIATLWRWPVTAAACVFLTDYTAAMWVAGTPLSVPAAVGFALALLFLLQSVALARAMRHATVDAAVVRSQIVGGMSFGVATLGAAMLVLAFARALTASVPFAAAPFAAAAGALAVVLAVATAAVSAKRGASRRDSSRPTSDERAQGVPRLG